MQLLLDNLSASIIAGVTILMIATLQLRAQQSAVEQAVFYQAKTRTLEFADVVGTEFSRIGEDLSDTSDPLVDFDTDNGQTNRFAFTRKIGGTDTQVVYELVQDTTYSVEKWDADQQKHVIRDVPVYHLERQEGTGSATRVMSNIAEWTVEPLDGSGDPTGTMADVRRLRVRLNCLFVLGEGADRIVHRTMWGTTFRPTGLRL